MTAHHPNFLEVIHHLEPVLRRHPPLAGMSFDDLADWMSWYWNRGTMTYVIFEDGTARGVCLIKLFRYLSQFMVQDIHDPCGRFCMIELIVSSSPITTAHLFRGLVNRWGAQDIMMWDRGERTDACPKMYTWKQFTKLARMISYGLTENA